MNIEELIRQNTAELALHRAALIENTAALREILSVGAVTAADTTPKKRAAKAEPLTVVEETPEPEPVVEPEPTQEQLEELQEAQNEKPSDAEPVEETPQVPDLPVAELRNSLKEVIKGKLLGDTEGQIKQTFDALRAKYGVAVIKELTDDQVGAFYSEVLRWG
jgi:outer membrane biosynthesis protein TonB